MPNPVIRGGDYLPCPKWVREDAEKLKAIFNPQPLGRKGSDDDLCFSWCVLRNKNWLGIVDPTNLCGPPLTGWARADDRFKQRGKFGGKGLNNMGNVADLYAAIEEGLIKHVELPPGMKYPLVIKDSILEEIERLNGISLSIFLVHQSERDGISPYFASKQQEDFESSPNRLAPKMHVRLGLIKSKKSNQANAMATTMAEVEYNAHFVLIRDMVGLMGKIKNKSAHGKTYYCDNCLNRFTNLEGPQGLKEHREGCLHNKPTRFSIPDENHKYIRFNKFKVLETHPFIIYADLEAVNAPAEEGRKEGTTLIVADHKISCWAYKIVVAPQYEGMYGNLIGYLGKSFKEIRSYVGHMAMDKFFAALKVDTDIMIDVVKNADHPMEGGEDLDLCRQRRDATDLCFFCHRSLPPVRMEGDPEALDIMNQRVLHHDHFDGTYKGVAHSRCNIGASLTKRYEVPVVFHNLKGYDGYHIIRATGECTSLRGQDRHLKVVAKSMEKFTSFTLGKKVRFIDSLQFLQASLDTLVRNLDSSVKPLQDKKRIFNLLGSWHRFPTLGAGEDESAVYSKFTKKGVYPYELAKSVEELFTIEELPSRKEFFSRLRGKKISKGEHRRARWAWDTFGCKNLADYTEAYCELDVLLLASVFEVFRVTTLESHAIDPAHFITLPSLSWQAMLLHNLRKGVVIETISQDNVGIDGFNMVEKGIRGGMCQVMQPFAESYVLPVEEAERHVQMECDERIPTEAEIDTPPDDGDMPLLNRDPKEDLEYYQASRPQDGEATQTSSGEEGLSEEQIIMYIDANNLYGGAMATFLPLGDFRWEKTPLDPDVTAEERAQAMEEVKHIDEFVELNELETAAIFESCVWRDPCMLNVVDHIMGIPDDNSRGYLLEVDLEYPQHLHDLHNDLPFCPESKPPPHPSTFSKDQYKKYGEYAANSAFKTNKLILDLTDKTHYVIHYRMLKLALKHGLVLRKVHRVMSFYQSNWLASYIQLNTDLRKMATNAVAKDMFKLLNNAIFGKTMEDVKNRRQIEFFYAHEANKAIKHASHPWMKAWREIVPGQLLAMEKARTSVMLDRPIPIGQAILDVSKVIMYETWYDKLRVHFSEPGAVNRISLLYCDTDSFICVIRGKKGKSVYRDLYELQKKHNMWDLSEMQFDANKPDDPMFNPPLLCYPFEGPGSELRHTMMENAKVLCKFKDEMKGVLIKEVVNLRPKMYSVKLMWDIIVRHHNAKKAAAGKTEPTGEITKKKGIPRNLPDEKDRLVFQHDNYKAVYFGGPTQKVSFPTINKTKTLSLYTGVQTKAAIAPLDDKSYWFNPASCVRYGHYHIEAYEQWLESRMGEDVDSMMTHEEEAAVERLKAALNIMAEMQNEEESMRLMLQEVESLPAYLVNDPIFLTDAYAN